MLVTAHDDGIRLGERPRIQLGGCPGCTLTHDDPWPWGRGKHPLTRNPGSGMMSGAFERRCTMCESSNDAKRARAPCLRIRGKGHQHRVTPDLHA